MNPFASSGAMRDRFLNHVPYFCGGGGVAVFQKKKKKVMEVFQENLNKTQTKKINDYNKGSGDVIVPKPAVRELFFKNREFFFIPPPPKKKLSKIAKKSRRFFCQKTLFFKTKNFWS